MFAGLPLVWIRRHTAGAERQGLCFDDLLTESMAGVRFGDARDVVTPTQFLLLCMTTMLKLDDAAHGLAKKRRCPMYPALGLRVALGYPTLGAALEELCRLYSIASTAIRMQVGTDGDFAVLSVEAEGRTDQDGMQLEEIYLGWMAMCGLYLLGRRLPIRGVSLRDPAHLNLGRQHWAMGGMVARGTVTSMRFPRRLLQEPVSTTAGSSAFWEAQRLWLAHVKDEDGAGTLDGYVHESHFVRFADMVSASGSSSNTLRRQLRPLNGGFREARRRALVQAATERLCGGDDSVEAIATELGYSDGRSFRRFLKNATGLTPQEVRHGGEAIDASEDLGALRKLKALAESMNL